MTKTRDLSDFLIEGGADLPLGVPHIIPGVLYPGYDDKQIDGTTALAASTTGPGGSTVTSSKYGTVQSDGRMYYYTDIKGSKPIKDPRIGGHFGSQRHTIRSRQLLEQETATNGKDIYSLDGREWFRLNDNGQSTTFMNDGAGNYIEMNGSGAFVEVVGYFNAMNILWFPYTSGDDFNWTLNGASAGSVSSGVSVSSPLGSRYVSAHSVYNLSFSSAPTLGINTVKITATSDDFVIGGVELIAQDTSSTANRSKIQIPSQNVVSFGKKFTVSGTPHYDPFTTMSYGGSGTTLSNLQSLIDTDTSLGMDAWKAGTSNYHRPWNGGRVVKWVDSSGTIKTSVNMMPPNAQNMGTTASNAVSDAHVIAGTNDDTINFNTSAIDHTQAEVAKTYIWREFGNGSANAGTNAGSYRDASMLSGTADDIAYVMDDGLTSLSANDVQVASSLYCGPDTDDYIYITFIGTGISVNKDSWKNLAQNLPYGTHILKLLRDGSGNFDAILDGVTVSSDVGWNSLYETTFHQPKKPPIPEDCVVLADYMLMADFVPATSVDGSISKGVRYCNASRDVFYDSAATITYNAGYQSLGYQFVSMYNNNANNEARITAFGSAYESHYVRGTNRVSNTQARLDGSNYSYVEADVYDTGGEWDDSEDNGTLTKVGSEAFHMFGIKNQTLGVHTFGDKNSSGSDYNAWSAFAVATPIHTSHHYKSFETPFLHELIGGDRNMEQTNLVCTPDGKTWDEITRDTSYIGNLSVVCTGDDDQTNEAVNNVLTDWRGGGHNNIRNYMNKDFAIAYDRIICLRDGQYSLYAVNYSSNSAYLRFTVNGSNHVTSYHSTGFHNNPNRATVTLNRGDYIQLKGEFGIDGDAYNHVEFLRVH